MPTRSRDDRLQPLSAASVRFWSRFPVVRCPSDVTVADDFLKGSNYIPFYQFSSRRGVRCPHHSANSQLADFIRVQCYFVYF